VFKFSPGTIRYQRCGINYYWQKNQCCYFSH